VLFWHNDHGVASLARLACFTGIAFFARGARCAGRAWDRHWDGWARNGNLLLNGWVDDGGRWWVDGGFFACGQADYGKHCYEQSGFHGGFLYMGCYIYIDAHAISRERPQHKEVLTPDLYGNAQRGRGRFTPI
jgi:hypothetical protein